MSMLSATGAADTGLPAARRRLRLGMVGGGRGAFIGAVHALAARMDNRWELVAGALSADPARARASAADWFIAPERAYESWAAMAEGEAKRPDGIDAVAIVTPNDTHHAIARSFLDQGIDVICDKPLTTRLEDARDLVRAVKRSGLVFAVTHTYSGYPMVRQARAMAAAGELGRIRLVHAEYFQDWLSTPLEETDHKQAGWRTDPARSGPGGCIADIGTHAFHLARFVSGLEAEALAAQLHTFVPGRRVDDNGHMLLRYGAGAQGTVIVSQVAPGNECGLRFRLYGEKAGLEWHQEQPNHLKFTALGKPAVTLSRAEPGLTAAAERVSRVPRGHPEGYLEAFANLYSEAAVAIEARRDGRKLVAGLVDFPTVEDGAVGVAFVEAAIDSSRRNGAWVEMPAGW
jgi:predicted dehydrogenase